MYVRTCTYIFLYVCVCVGVWVCGCVLGKHVLVLRCPKMYLGVQYMDGDANAIGSLITVADGCVYNTIWNPHRD